MIMKAVLLVLIFPMGLLADSSSDLMILKSGQLLKTVTLENLKKAQTVDSLTAYEPIEKRKKVYTGLSIIPLLESLYGSDILKKYDTVVFHCQDGYRTDIALNQFYKTKALLAFAQKNDVSFSLRQPQTQTKIQLGPYYLTWDRPAANSLNDKNFPWPYGIHKIELLQSSIAYAPLMSSGFSKGHQEFMIHCYSCHQFNGVGGQRGPPLNLFIKNKQKSELVKFILDPKSLIPNSQMSGLPKDLPGRVQTAEAIINYLKLTQRSEL